MLLLVPAPSLAFAPAPAASLALAVALAPALAPDLLKGRDDFGRIPLTLNPKP